LYSLYIFYFCHFSIVALFRVNRIVVGIHIRISIAVAAVDIVLRFTLNPECCTSDMGVRSDLHTSDRRSQLYFMVSAGLSANLLGALLLD
jgi:hypothetical protein